MSIPLLSVIMPVYNAEQFVAQAIGSILHQTYDNLELIIVDDGSSDNSVNVIQSFKDDRIKLYRNDGNHGIVYSRNKGLKLAKGDYIGMFDADDVAYPEKFEEQIAFFGQHNDYGMVGSWAKFIDEQGKQVPGRWKLRASPEMIPAIMLFQNYFLQSAVLYRKECISKYSFREGFDILEDYLIWIEITRDFKAWNLQKYLVNYRIHDDGVTKKYSEEKLEKEKKVFWKQLMNLGIDATEHELDLHLLIRNEKPVTEINTLKSIEKWLLKIIVRNEDMGVYDHKILIHVIFNRWVKVCYKASRLSFKMVYHFFTSQILYIFIKNYGTPSTNVVVKNL